MGHGGLVQYRHAEDLITAENQKPNNKVFHLVGNRPNTTSDASCASRLSVWLDMDNDMEYAVQEYSLRSDLRNVLVLVDATNDFARLHIRQTQSVQRR